MVEVKFHDIGEGMTEGEVVRYLIDVGDHVKVDQPLVELQTDKMVAELPSPAAGTIKKVHVEEGTVVDVGTTLLEIEGFEEQASDAKDTQTSKAEPVVHYSNQDDPSVALQASAGVAVKQPETVTPQPPKRIKAAPYTRKVARENDVDIEQVAGTGQGGRITVEDIHRFKAYGNTTQSQKAVGTEVIDSKQESTEIPFTGVRRQIARKMTHSMATIPHVTHFDEVDLTNLQAIRKRLKDSGEPVSVAAFFVKALALSLRDFPVLNGELDEQNHVIHTYNHYHIGIATDTEKGLLVPVIKHVEQKSIRDIHTEMKSLTEKAQNGELTIPEMQHATFTMSNVGPLGGTGATPIINHPETSIIAFHKTKKTPVVMENDEMVIRSIMNMSFSFDHRVCDGAMAVRFTNRFSEWIENPETLLMELK